MGCRQVPNLHAHGLVLELESRLEVGSLTSSELFWEGPKQKATFDSYCHFEVSEILNRGMSSSYFHP